MLWHLNITCLCRMHMVKAIHGAIYMYRTWARVNLYEDHLKLDA